MSLLARLFIKTEEVLSPPARRRRHRQRRLRPVKFWEKLLRQKIMSSFISSLAQNLFIFAVLIHKVVLINNQTLINIHMYYFSHFFHVFGNYIYHNFHFFVLIICMFHLRVCVKLYAG